MKELKSSKSIKPIKKEVKSVQSANKILKCKVCELKFKDKHELKEHWTETEVFCCVGVSEGDCVIYPDDLKHEGQEWSLITMK